MQILRTAAVAVAITVALSAGITCGGTVTFYQHAEFGGVKFPVAVSKPQRCFNIGCFNDRASSVDWKDIPIATSSKREFCYDWGPSWVPRCEYWAIALYSDADCKGDYQRWVIKDMNFPAHLYDLNDRVSSFMIWENSETKGLLSNGFELVCPFPRRLEEANSTITPASRDNYLHTAATEQHDTN